MKEERIEVIKRILENPCLEDKEKWQESVTFFCKKCGGIALISLEDYSVWGCRRCNKVFLSSSLNENFVQRRYLKEK